MRYVHIKKKKKLTKIKLLSTKIKAKLILMANRVHFLKIKKILSDRYNNPNYLFTFTNRGSKYIKSNFS